jgi:hypothetical protein
MAESLDSLKGARFEDYVPLFVHRFPRDGTITKEVPEVLFVCV